MVTGQWSWDVASMAHGVWRGSLEFGMAHQGVAWSSGCAWIMGCDVTHRGVAWLIRVWRGSSVCVWLMGCALVHWVMAAHRGLTWLIRVWRESSGCGVAHQDRCVAHLAFDVALRLRRSS